MHDFQDQAAARLVARLAREALFDAANAEAPEFPPADLSPGAPPAPARADAAPPAAVSKRDFLRGRLAAALSIEGEIPVTLHWDGSACAVRPGLDAPAGRRARAARSPAGDAAALVPRLYALCGQAQGAACAAALRAGRRRRRRGAGVSAGRGAGSAAGNTVAAADRRAALALAAAAAAAVARRGPPSRRPSPA